MTKESQALWQKLQAHHGFELTNTLFVDDSMPVLASAKKYGFEHLLAVANPDSKKPIQVIDDYPAITDYSVLLKEIIANPV